MKGFYESMASRDYSYPNSMVTYNQVKYLYEACLRIKPKIIVECGTGYGDSTRALAFGARDCGAGSHVYTIDLLPQRNPFAEEKLIEAGLLDFVTGFTMNDLDFNPPAPIDMMFIDTFHYYDQATKELDYFVPLLSEKGEIFFDATLHSGHYREMSRAVVDWMFRTKGPPDATCGKYNYEVIATEYGLGRVFPRA